ncbi:MAG: LysM peptidoglycan-binding domain-containing protein [Terrimonas sp.]|nr:LysM peptidoglycan-binding domain-containing protein [Terrimonas sp.]
MKHFRRLFLISLLFSALILEGQQSDPAVLEYIARYKDMAIREMIRTGVPAAIKLAQGIHETDAGQSELVQQSNNHFGIKCKNNWTGETVTHTDDAPNECFRKYSSPEDSYRDHSDFLKNSSRYAFLFKLDPTDYSAWAYGLKKAGYATNPKYPQIIINLIRDYNLEDYTLIALGRKTEEPEILVRNAGNEKENSGLHFLNIKAPGEEGDANNVSPAVDMVVSEKPVISYPEGEFKINDTRVIFAKAGTPYLSIAQTYDVPLARIFDFNEVSQMELVPRDQLVFLQRKRKTGNNTTHIVQEGESLYDIAQQEAIRLSSLAEYNNISIDWVPNPGEILYLKEKAKDSPTRMVAGRSSQDY